MNSAAALMLAISSASSEAKWPFKMVCSRSCLCRSSPFGFDMDVHSIGGPQRSAKSFYSSQSPFNRDRQLKHPCGLADRAVSIDRRDCGGANSLLLPRVLPARLSPRPVRVTSPFPASAHGPDTPPYTSGFPLIPPPTPSPTPPL